MLASILLMAVAISAYLAFRKHGYAARHYLDRNLAITNAITGGARVRLYFTAGELAALPQATLATLQVTNANTNCQAALCGASTIIFQDTVQRYDGDYFIEFSTYGLATSLWMASMHLYPCVLFPSSRKESRKGLCRNGWY